MSKDTLVLSAQGSMNFTYVKLHTALFVPGVTAQTNTTLDSKTPGYETLKMSVEGQFLSVTLKGKQVFTPISNVIVLAVK